MQWPINKPEVLQVFQDIERFKGLVSIAIEREIAYVLHQPRRRRCLGLCSVLIDGLCLQPPQPPDAITAP